MGIVLYSIARIYAAQRRFPEAEKCLRESIDMLQDQKIHLNMLATASNYLVQNLIAQRRYDDALQAAHETEEVNRRYEEAAKSPRPSAWYNLWLSYIDLYRQTYKFDEAQTYLNKVDSITKGSVKLYKEQGHVFYGLKRYHEALEMLDKAIEVSPNTLEAKGLKLMTLIQMNEREKAVELFYKVVNELEAGYNTDFNTKLDEIRTQHEVDKYVAEKEHNRIYFLFTLSICLVLLILLAGAIYYNRLISTKNRRLYERIKEQDRLSDELSCISQTDNKAAAPKTSGEATAEAIDSNEQHRLVARLRGYLLSNESMTSSDITRDDIIAELGTNKKRIDRCGESRHREIAHGVYAHHETGRSTQNARPPPRTYDWSDSFQLRLQYTKHILPLVPEAVRH